MRALLFLLWRDTLGQGRLLWRRLRTPRGAATVLFFALLIGGAFALSTTLPNSPVATASSEGFRTFAPLVLLAMVTLGVLSPRGLYFRPAEVAWLFPAPLRRRHLVLFNVLSRARMAAFSALWLAAFPALRGRNVATTLLGYLLCLLLLQISAQWFAVVRVWSGARTGGRRRVALFGVSALAILALTYVAGGLEALTAVIPTRPFTEVVAAETTAAGLLWAVPCVALLVALVASLASLDMGYLETAMTRSHGAEAQRNRVRAGGGAFGGGPRSHRIRLPHFPRLRGAGPVAWRQCMEVIRNPRGVLLVLLVVMTGAGGVVLPPYVGGETGTLPPVLLPAIGAGMVFAASLLMGDNLAFDFRRDLDRMGVLKALPLSPLAIASGQVAAGTLFVCAIQGIGITAIVLGTGVFPWGSMAWLFLLLPPANWSAIAIDNAIFLLLPYRTVAEDPGDVSFVGRTMLSIALKLAILCVIGGSGTLAGFAAYRLSGGSLSVAALAAAGLFVCACLPLTRLVAWAFDRFDVARDVPA